MSDNSCLVCNSSCDGRLRNGIVACQACKSFFLRYQPSGVGLKCAIGSNDCPIATDNQCIADGRRFRFVCPKCRFQRCQNVGMKIPKGNVTTGKRIKSHQTIEIKDVMEGQSSGYALLPQIKVGTSTKEILNSLIQVFMDIQCVTRLNRIFNAAPAAMNQSNFNKLQTFFPDFQVCKKIQLPKVG